MIEDPQLREHRCLIPIEPLIGDLAAFKLNDQRHGKFDASIRGRHAGKHPIHLQRMRKANDELFDDPIAAEGFRQRSEFPIRRDIRQEAIGSDERSI